MMQLNEAVAGAAMSSLYPDMRFSWEIKSVDALFCNGMTRVGDLSREAILASLRDSDLSVLKDEVNKNLFNDKKFCKECTTVCVKYTQNLEIVEEMIDFLYSTSEETRRHVDACIKDALACAVKIENEKMVIGILTNFHNNKKIKTLSDITELVEHAIYSAAVEENSAILQTILKWNQNHKTKKFTHKSKAYAGSTGPKVNSASMLYAAKHNDYERVKILFRYGYRLERIDRITDPLKRIEIFKAITSPAYIVATLENVNDVSSEFFCPVKKCFELACEAQAKARAMPEYKREYSEIEQRCENFAIKLLEQCENLDEVEMFLQTKTQDGTTHKDANYIMAILDMRKAFVAHERFQYVLLKKFGEIDLPQETYNTTRQQLLWIDMPWYLRCLHVIKQVPCYFLLFLFPFFSTCCPWSNGTGDSSNIPWFAKQWRVPLNRCIYTAFSYLIFLLYITLYVAEVQPPTVHVIDVLTAVWIISYTFRDIGTAYFLWQLESPKPILDRRFFKRYLTFWHLYNIVTNFFFLVGLLMKLLEYFLVKETSEEALKMIDMNGLAASGRILWGAAFSLAIVKTIKVGIASKLMGPIILSINSMMKDVVLFLVTFTVIMVAFASGVSYIFNMASDQQGSGTATAGVFGYFFWVLLQPFRGNPEYRDVADLPYNSSCLNSIGTMHTDMKTLSKCIVETLYNTSCIIGRIADSQTRINRKDIAGCLVDKDAGFGYLKSAAVPMWAVYQFMISVVLLRILIVMMTITYRKIYDDLDKHWKYHRAYTGIQFFDSDSLLPPPFTFLSILVLIFQKCNDRRRLRSAGSDGQTKHAMEVNNVALQSDSSYQQLIFQLIDNAKPRQNRHSGVVSGGG